MNEERDQTLNQLLTELDGFEGREGVLLLAATNRAEVPSQTWVMLCCAVICAVLCCAVLPCWQVHTCCVGLHTMPCVPVCEGSTWPPLIYIVIPPTLPTPFSNAPSHFVILGLASKATPSS